MPPRTLLYYNNIIISKYEKNLQANAVVKMKERRGKKNKPEEIKQEASA